MRQDLNHEQHFARPVSLGEDFALIFEAFADTFRGLASLSPPQCNSTKIHFAGWR